MWLCKLCKFVGDERKILYMHVKMCHSFETPFVALPCLYKDCAFTFLSLSRLRGHLSINHHSSSRDSTQFRCSNCSKTSVSITVFLAHLRSHCAKFENVTCPFAQCPFQSNRSNTFRGHISRMHKMNDISAQFLKPELCVGKSPYKQPAICNVEDANISQSDDGDDNLSIDLQIDESCSNVSAFMKDNIERQFALCFLKMEVVHKIPVSTIDEICKYLIQLHELSVPMLNAKINNILSQYDVSESIILEVTSVVRNDYPLYQHMSKDGFLSTSSKRECYFRSHLTYVQPVEYDLGIRSDTGKRCSFIYVPLLATLKEIINKPDVLSLITKTASKRQSTYITSTTDGTYYNENRLYSVVPNAIQIGLYFDDFEIANPLGTARKKHKLSGFYFVLANIPPEHRSTLNHIQLCVLCRSNDLLYFGQEAILKVFLQDVALLEEHGIFIESLGSHLRGTVSYLSADNLAAHSLGGFQESFGPNVNKPCRYCLIDRVEMRDSTVSADSMPFRNKVNYDIHAAEAENQQCTVAGIKTNCIFHKYLTYFHITKASPPDVAHDLLEGIVPFELALCLHKLIVLGFFSLVNLNHKLATFPYEYTDSTNRPQ